MCVRVLCMYMYHKSVIYVAKKICYLAIFNLFMCNDICVLLFTFLLQCHLNAPAWQIANERAVPLYNARHAIIH